MKARSIFLCLLSLSVFPVAAHAAVVTITVTTTADEDGENGAACSLREALKAVKNKLPYGGCPRGGVLQDSVIQLGAGHYTLTAGQLLLDAPLTIAGKNTVQADVKNPYTGKFPNRLRPDDATTPGTFIHGKANNRVILATSDLTLRDLVLEATGTTPIPLADNNGNGGVLYSTGTLALDNVVLKGGNVSGSGGAIFMARDGSSLNVNDTAFESNEAAKKGGAIAMACSEGLNPFAVHLISVLRSAFVSNTSATGAGAFDICGNTTATISETTFSANASGPGSAALAYQQPPPVPNPNTIGVLTLSYITAAENDLFLAVSNISTLTVTGSFIAFNSTGGCLVGIAPTTKSGTFNATDDAVCKTLFTAGSTAGNLDVTGTTLAAELSSLNYHGGLTKNYLPGANSLFVKDKGDALDNCAATDQRNLTRQSGSNVVAAAKCDIGAVERLQVTANDDEAESRIATDRLAIVDVLANDTFSESNTGPVGYGSPAVVVELTSQSFVVVPGNSSVTPAIPPVMGSCVWHPDDTSEPNAAYRGRLVIDNAGVLTPDDTPVECKYHVVDANGNASLPATVSATIINAAPHAIADLYIRPQGVPAISFNPVGNDDDDGDGIYGKASPVWADFPIYISEQPDLGTVQGVASGPCADAAVSPVVKTCLKPPLTYTATNGQSPFTDSFTYSVFDRAGKMSRGAVVTVKTDAPDPDKGETGGSLDILGGLILALLGLRRTRKL